MARFPRGFRSRVAARARAALLCAATLVIGLASGALAAPYAAMVVDARSGEVLHARSADTRLHPASLTKMMTLYVVFDAVARGEIGLDDHVVISRHAASRPPSKLGLRAGQRIALRYLIRGSAVKSANDAATAMAEAVSGSEAAFARRMTRTARGMGMSRTTFRNAHGLTQDGHLSTARDMTILGRRLFYDHPAYYNLFSRMTTDAGVKQVRNTNRRLLSSYRGADGIKTGYTRAAGFNLVASAERGGVRIIATVFGGDSGASRDARVAELLDMGFQRAPRRAAVSLPPMGAVARGPVLAVTRSLRPRARPAPVGPVDVDEALVVAMVEGATGDGAGEAALGSLVAGQVAAEVAARRAVSPAAEVLAPEPAAPPRAGAITVSRRPAPRAASASAPPPEPARAEAPATGGRLPNPAALASTAGIAAVEETTDEVLEEVVLRPSPRAPRGWRVAVGRHATRHQAERVLLTAALTDAEALGEARREVVSRPTGWEARFVGLTEEVAGRVCRRLRARGSDCEAVAASG